MLEGKDCPIEVSLTNTVNGIVFIVTFDEDVTFWSDVEYACKAQTLRSAERSVSRRLIAEGYEPAGDWKETFPGSGIEVRRRFKPAKALEEAG